MSVPMMAGALLLVRGLPRLLVAPEAASRADRRAIVLFAATGLPDIVAVSQIGVDEVMLHPIRASSLVGAGMLSVLLFPALGLGRRMRERIGEVPSLLGDGWLPEPVVRRRAPWSGAGRHRPRCQDFPSTATAGA